MRSGDQLVSVLEIGGGDGRLVAVYAAIMLVSFFCENQTPRLHWIV